MSLPALVQSPGLDHEKRLRSISATDVAKILGVHPCESAWDVYAVKTGLVKKPPVTSEPAEIGNALQVDVARIYQERTGEPVVWWDETQTHPSYEWATATPDARLAQARIDGKRGLLEIKTAGYAQVYKWGPSWSDEFPPEYRAQMGWQCFVTGYDFCDLAVLLGAESLTVRIYRFEPTKEYLEDLRDKCCDFWFDHVVARVPPETKPTTLADIFLKSIPEVNDFREPTTEEYEWIEELFSLKKSAAPNKKRLDELEVKLKAAIGECSGLRWGDGHKISYKAPAPSESTDWQAVAQDLSLLIAPSKRERAFQVAIAHHTTSKPGTRRFLPKLKGDK